jgi:hypothetical protein
MWTDLPKQLLYEETRIMAEPSISSGVISTTADNRVMKLPFGVGQKIPAAVLATDGTLRAGS